jgi:hypothetical protein
MPYLATTLGANSGGRPSRTSNPSCRSPFADAHRPKYAVCLALMEAPLAYAYTRLRSLPATGLTAGLFMSANCMEPPVLRSPAIRLARSAEMGLECHDGQWDIKGTRRPASLALPRQAVSSLQARTRSPWPLYQGQGIMGSVVEPPADGCSLEIRGSLGVLRPKSGDGHGPGWCRS